LMVAEGRIERETEHAEVPITHLICRRLLDRSDMLGSLNSPVDDGSWGEAMLGRADEVRRPNPGSPRGRAGGMPGSRDFR
jgi:error-prone DNA polymerase